jgi:hypothetical protein
VIAFATTVRVGVPPAALCELAIDLPRYVRVEPRLRAARWLEGGGPWVGASAEVVAEISFSTPIMDRVIGPPRGVARLEGLDPGSWLAYSLETPKAEGYLDVHLVERGGATVVTARGWIHPLSATGRAYLRPLAPVLGHVVSRVVSRAVLRAAAALE